jgi:ATP-dependent DNA ligase
MRWEPTRLIYVAFDLLHLDGRETRFKPTIERKAALEALIGRSGGAIQYSEHIEGGGQASSCRRIGSASRAWCPSGRALRTAAVTWKAG